MAATAVESVPLDIEAIMPREQIYAGDWFTLILVLKRPTGYDTDVRLRNVSCEDKDIQLDIDLLDRDLQIRPGESYQLTVPMRVPHPKVIRLDSMRLQVAEPGHDSQQANLLLSLPNREMVIHPAIGKEIALRIKPICGYEEGTKVHILLEHQGCTPFDELTVNLKPEQAIRAGKRTVCRSRFGPGDREEFDVVVTEQNLEVALTASVDGERTQWHKTETIRRPPPAQELRFRFLEPRRLTSDKQLVYQQVGQERRPVGKVHSAHLLQSGEQYQIVIQPLQPNVIAVEVRDIPGILHVRDKKQGADGWTFLVDVSFPGLFSKPERLFYEIECPDGSFGGVVPLCLRPAQFKHAKVAAALGLAVTLQGLNALAKFLVREDFGLEEIATDFSISSDFNLLFLFSIPICWALLGIADWVQYRLRT